jgi:hypothetical protein
MDDEAFKAAVMTRFDRVDARLDAIYQRLEDHEQRFDDLNRRMGNLENGVSYVATNTEQALDRIRVMSRRVDALENPEAGKM